MQVNPSQSDLAIIDDLQGLSMVSGEVALRRPMADLVQSTLQAAGRSANTVRAYQYAIGSFLQWLEQERGEALPDDWKPLATPTNEALKDGRGRGYTRTRWEYRGYAAALRLVDAALVDGFRVAREHAGDSPNAASLRLYAVRTFLSVALRDGIITQPQGQAIGIQPYKQKQMKDDQPVGRRLSPAEVRSLRGVVDTTTNKGKRDLAILDTMLYAALRSDETASLRLSDFRQDGGRWWVVLKGKGSKTRRIKLHDVLFKSISRWLDAAGLHLGTDGPLFRSVNKGDVVSNHPINRTTVSRIVAEYGFLSGLAPSSGPNQLSPHDCRRTCSRNAYDNGASLLIIQQMLGHSSVTTTTLYIGVVGNDDDTATDYLRY